MHKKAISDLMAFLMTRSLVFKYTKLAYSLIAEGSSNNNCASRKLSVPS